MFESTTSGKAHPTDHGLDTFDQSPRSATATTFAHSLTSIPAGLEVVPTNDKQAQQSEKEAVQAGPEAISQADKEVDHRWATGHGNVVASQGGEERVAKRRISILSTASSLVNLLKSGVSGVVESEDDARTRYTIAMVRQLRLENPDKNVLIFQNPASVVHFDKNAASCRTTLDLGLGFSPEFETYVLDHGEFTLLGRGGFTNWCFDGNYTQDGNQVVFNGISLPGDESQAPAPKAPALPASSPARLDSSHEDGNYFVNCSGPNETVASRMAYYSQLNPGHNVNQQPTDSVEIKNNTYLDWTVPGAVTFPNTSITVHWSIFGGAETHDINATVSTADNGYESFWIFKDTGDILYEADGWTCRSVYWAY